MLFNSLSFLAFISIFLISFQLISGNSRILLCLVSSYIFYSFFNLQYVLIIIFITIINFYTGILLETFKSSTKRKFILCLSVILSLSSLFFFKYYDFFLTIIDKISILNNLNFNNYYMNMILPVGISFFTFQALSYSIDVYKKKIPVEKNLLIFSTFISFFPQLVAGPIVRAKKLIPQLKKLTQIKLKNFYLGVELIITGFFLKLCVADRLALFVDPTYDSPERFGGLVHLLATFFFSFQIYADFAGYSLIAIGLGRLIGLNFGINFKRPYFSCSFQEFWRRWHISLSSWLRDYLYIPLGGNRRGKIKKYNNFLIVMTIGGLWHGASINFVLWGLFHGILLIINDLFNQKFYLPKTLKIIFVFLTISFLWIIFRANDIETFLEKIYKIFSYTDYFSNFSFDLFNMIIGLLMITIFIIYDFIKEKFLQVSFFFRIIISLLFIWMITFLGIFKGTHFVYFQF